MPTEFKIPELGENVTSGDVVRILVKAGEPVAKDQPVLELETDKATIEVPSTVEGTVKDIRVKQGDKVKVGQLVLTVEDGAGAATGAAAGEGEEAASKPAAGDKAEARAKPSAGEKAEAAGDRPKAQPAGGAEEGGLSQVAPGKGGDDAPEADAGGAAKGAAERGRGTTRSDPEETFASGERPAAPAAAPEGEGGKQKPRGEVVAISRAARTAPPPPAPAPEAAQPAPAAPSVRRLARELGVDIREVPGSGTGGRINLEDVQAFVRGALGGGQTGAAPQPGAAPLPDFAKWGAVERKPMSNVRRKTAEHLSNAWRTVPHVTQHDKADITSIEALRKQYAPQAEKAGGKLTMTAIALKVAAGALRKYPQFNASIDPARNEIAYKKSIHVGVAVDTDRGLLVPVIRDVDTKGIVALSIELAQVSEKARGGKLSLDEMQGGGFTITNLGGIGGTSFTPIVNWPEVAILGISRGAQEPQWDGGQFQPRLMLPLSLSYDHRVIDGADAARFLRWVCDAFEQPFVMAL